MPRCNKKNVCYSNIINKTLQNVINYATTTNIGSKQNFSGKVREESVEAI